MLYLFFNANQIARARALSRYHLRCAICCTTRRSLACSHRYYNGMIYFSVEDSMSLMQMNATTGNVVWQYSGATQEFNGSPSIDTVSGIVYAGANDKYVCVRNDRPCNSLCEMACS